MNAQPPPTALGLERMRFAPEYQKLDQLVQTFGLELILSHFEREAGLIRSAASTGRSSQGAGVPASAAACCIFHVHAARLAMPSAVQPH